MDAKKLREGIKVANELSKGTEVPFVYCNNGDYLRGAANTTPSFNCSRNVQHS